MTAAARKRGVSVASDWLSFVLKESGLAVCVTTIDDGEYGHSRLGWKMTSSLQKCIAISS